MEPNLSKMARAFEKIWCCYKKGCSISFTARAINEIYEIFHICVLIVEFWFDKFSEDDFDYYETFLVVTASDLDTNVLKDFVEKYPYLNTYMIRYVFENRTSHIRENLFSLGFIRFHSKWRLIPLHEP